jgi:diguanylate cyclase (GGDEF)-like protein
VTRIITTRFPAVSAAESASATPVEIPAVDSSDFHSSFGEDEGTDVFMMADAGLGALQEAERDYIVTVVSGPQTGMIRALDKPEMVLGRGQGCDLQLDDPALSRRHCRISRIADGLTIEDLGSSNGTFVDGSAVRSALKLEEGAHIHLGRHTVLSLSRQNQSEQNAARQLYESSMRDALTGMHNRRYLDQRMREELSYAARHRTGLGLLLLDIDHFKRVNDTWGHPAGDMVLRHVAQLIDSCVRKEDVAARFGGEEFAVLGRNTESGGARALAERIRKRVEDSPVYFEKNIILVTLSVGVAVAEPPRVYEAPGAFLAAADQALYRAKQGGRNRCEQA